MNQEKTKTKCTAITVNNWDESLTCCCSNFSKVCWSQPFYSLVSFNCKENMQN